jgi:Rrf2 family protein
MLSRTSEYALRAVLCLARFPLDQRVPATEVAERLEVPSNYLSKILHTLARTGLLVSERGPTGGFRLSRPASEISLVDVIEPFDRVGQEGECLLGRNRCNEINPCAAHESWKSVSEQVIRFFQETSVADLLEPAGPPAGVNL